MRWKTLVEALTWVMVLVVALAVLAGVTWGVAKLTGVSYSDTAKAVQGIGTLAAIVGGGLFALSRIHQRGRYSSGDGDEWQRGAMVRAGFRVDGSGGGLSAAAWRPCGRLRTLAGRDGRGEGAARDTRGPGVTRVCGAVG